MPPTVMPAVTTLPATPPPEDARQPRAASLAPMMMELDDIRLPDSTPRSSLPPVGSTAELENKFKAEQALRAALETKVASLEARLAQSAPPFEERADVATLKGELAHRKLEISNLLRRMADAESDRDQERQRSAETEKRAQEQRTRHASQVEALANDVETLRGEVDTALASMQELAGELEQTRLRESAATRALDDGKREHDAALTTLQSQFQDVTVQLHAAIARMHDEQRRAESSNAEAHRLHGLLTAATGDNTTLRQLIEDRDTRIRETDALLDAANARAGAAEESLRELNERNEEALAALQHRVDDAMRDALDKTAELEAARNTLTGLQAAQAALEDAFRQVQTSLDEKSAQHQRLESETAALRAELEERARAVANLEQNVADTTDAADALREKADRLEASLAEAMAQSTASQARIEALEVELSAADTWRVREKQRADDREKDLRSLAADVTRTEERARKLEALMDSERSRADGMRAQAEQEKARGDEAAARLRAQLDEERKRADQAQADQQRAREEHGTLERRLSETREALDAARAREAAAKEKLAALESELAEKDALTQRLEALMESAAQQASDAYERERILVEERDALAERLKG